MGAETLSDQVKPLDQSWVEFTFIVLNAATASRRLILFDLTYMEELKDLLQGIGRYANTITAIELRYIFDHWDVFGSVVQFYENGVEREAPWII